MRSFAAFTRKLGYELEPFQRRMAAACFSPEPETLILLSRGEAKTTFGGLFGLHHLRTVPRPAVYLCSTSRDEARTGWETSSEFAAHPSLVGDITIRHLELRVPGGHLRVLASDARLNLSHSPTLVILDELHAFRDDSLYVAMRSSLHKRGGKIVIFSCAGDSPDSALGRLRARALAQPHVVRHTSSLTEAWGGGIRLLEWSVPDDADVDKPHLVKRACPASWVTAEAIAEQRAALPDLAFRRYLANQWAGREHAWLKPGAWAECAGKPSFQDGERVWVAVDLSGGGGRSSTAVVWVNESLQVGCEIWSGDHDATAEVAALLDELASRYTVVELVLDFWRASALASEFEQRGLTVVSYPQTDQRMIPASGRLDAAITEGRLVHPDDPTLNEHVHNAISVSTRRGSRISRPGGAEQHVDGVIALCMAVDRAEHQVEPVKLLGWL